MFIYARDCFVGLAAVFVLNGYSEHLLLMFVGTAGGKHMFGDRWIAGVGRNSLDTQTTIILRLAFGAEGNEPYMPTTSPSS